MFDALQKSFSKTLDFSKLKADSNRLTQMSVGIRVAEAPAVNNNSNETVELDKTPSQEMMEFGGD